MPPDDSTDDWEIRDIKSQIALIDFLRAELNDIRTILEDARFRSAMDAEERQLVSLKLTSALSSIRTFAGLIKDANIKYNLHSEVEELESAARMFAG